MYTILGILIFIELVNIGMKLSSNNIYQREIISRLQQIEKELSYNKIANRRLTDITIHNQDIVSKLSEIKEDVVNLRYYVGAVYHDELKEFAKKKEKGL